MQIWAVDTLFDGISWRGFVALSGTKSLSYVIQEFTLFTCFILP